MATKRQIRAIKAKQDCGVSMDHKELRLAQKQEDIARKILSNDKKERKEINHLKPGGKRR